MSNNLVKTIPKLVWYSIGQAVALAVLLAFLLSFVYGFVYHYQQKLEHIEQLATMLADNASTPDGAKLVAKQVSALLDDDPSLQSILFYSTERPISYLDQDDIERAGYDWRNALFADRVSINRAVTSRYPTSNSTITGNTTLMGYINVTLDIHQLRMDWIRRTLPLWLLTVITGILLVWFILRKLNWPTNDLTELAKVCKMVTDDPSLVQLPVIQQRFEFQELLHIKQAFITLFDRMRATQKDYDALAEFEQQLHNKDMSLDVQHHNFQSMITHELKTSLNAISGGVQLLDNQYLNDEQKDTLDIIHKGSRHLEQTLEQIIQLNKIEKGQMAINVSEFNPLQMLSDLLAEFDSVAKQKGLALISRVHHIDYVLEGDASKIQQILSSLIDNAIKFTKEGQVTIQSQLMHFNESIHWRIQVIDTGIGISANYMEDIFTPFFQVDSSRTKHYEGVGVGLPVIKQMVQLIGASIEVDSELGVGSTFSITIPLRNKFQSRQQTQLSGLHIIYYHIDNGQLLVKEMQRLGATVNCEQHEQLVVEQLVDTSVDMVMISEEIAPDKAGQIAHLIREQEDRSRVLIVYWYPPHKERTVDSFEHGLKAAGVDHCHQSTHDPKVLAKLFKSWLA